MTGGSCISKGDRPGRRAVTYPERHVQRFPLLLLLLHLHLLLLGRRRSGSLLLPHLLGWRAFPEAIR